MILLSKFSEEAGHVLGSKEKMLLNYISVVTNLPIKVEYFITC